MAVDQILAITQIAENQNNKYLTHNNAVDALAQAGNRTLRNTTVGAGPWNITENEFTRNMVFRASGASANYEIRTPGTIATSNPTKRVFAVVNDDTVDTATVRTAGVGAQVVLPPGRAAWIEQEGDNLYQLSAWSTVPTDAQPYDFGFFIAGPPGTAAIVLVHVAARAFTLEDNFAGSVGKVGANPTAVAAFDVQKNEASIGSISISTSGVFTFNTTGAGVSMVAGDRIKIVAPNPQDATLADVAVTLKGTRV